MQKLYRHFVFNFTSFPRPKNKIRESFNRNCLTQLTALQANFRCINFSEVVLEQMCSGFIENVIVSMLAEHRTHESLQCSGLNIIATAGKHPFAFITLPSKTSICRVVDVYIKCFTCS